MAKNRMINTKFWSDGWIRKLAPSSKLVFVYLLTNPNTELCGGYELPIDTICFDIGLTITEVEEALALFEMSKKIVRSGDWIYVYNWKRHQLSNPSVQKGIERSEKLLPEHLRLKIEQIDRLGTDCIQTGYTMPHFNLNLNLNPNLNLNSNLDPNLNPNLKDSTIVECAEHSPPEKIKEEESEKKISYGNEEINGMLSALKARVGVEDFADASKWSRIYAKNCLSLMHDLGKPEFLRRLDKLLEDDFHRKNCNKIKYIYYNIKGFIEPRNQGIVFIS